MNAILPRQLDNRFEGHRAALWLLGFYVVLKLIMSLNSIFNTESVAVGADGFRIDSYGDDGARAVLMLFAMVAVGQLTLALIAITALVRYRALVPFVFLVLIGEHLGRRLIVQAYAVPRVDSGSAGWYVNMALLALLALGLVLSLLLRRKEQRA